MIHSCTHARVENTLLFISTYKDIQNTLVTTHIYIFFWKEYLRACSRYCAQNYICSYPKHLLFTNYLYMFEMYIILIFIVSPIFIYMHVGKLITLCTHFCIQNGLSRHLIYTWGAIPHHIFIWEAFLCHLWHGYIFLKGSLCYLSTNIHIWKALFTILSFCKVFSCHIFTYIYTVERYFPCYLGARYLSWGSQT